MTAWPANNSSSLDAEFIRRVKILAIDRGVSASSLLQEAIIEFLARSNVAQAQD